MTGGGGVSKPTRGPWPHGQPTKRCPSCEGKGASPGAIARVEQSRDPALVGYEAARCATCRGRGRVLDRPVTRR